MPIQMAPLALCNYIAYDLLGSDGGKKSIDEKKSTNVKESADKTFKRKCIVALDIGADGSTLVITDADRIIWQRSIPPGGNHFTRALTKDMKLTFAKAEHLKRNATKSPDLKRILAALKPVLNEFVGEVQRSLNYFTNTHRDAHIEYMIGLGNAFRLPGLQKFLAEKLQLDVRKLQKLENVEGDSVLIRPGVLEQRAELRDGVRAGAAGAEEGKDPDEPAAAGHPVRAHDPGEEALGGGGGGGAAGRLHRHGAGIQVPARRDLRPRGRRGQEGRGRARQAGSEVGSPIGQAKRPRSRPTRTPSRA